MDANARYCEAQVREFARDRYLATLFAPSDRRVALYALYAFDIELARIRDLAREPMPGEIRLQWWRDVLEGKRDGEARAHPVAAILMDTLDRYGVDRAGLQAMVDARTFDLYNEPFAIMDDWQRYARATRCELIASAMRVIAGEVEVGAGVARHVGFAVAGLDSLRGLPLHLSRGQCFVPLDVLKAFGARLEDGLAGRMTPEWKVALASVRQHIRDDLDAAFASIDDVPQAALPVLLPCAVIRPILARMDMDSSNPLLPDELPQWRRQWLLWRAARNPRRIFG
ncbi:MAG: phytoene/squalene synthase family protein [Pseudolabrys sp.]